MESKENTDTGESKDEDTDIVESKSDEEAGSNDEDLEGLSEDSSMSGMSTNANSKNEDSNADEKDDDDDDNSNEDKMIEWEDEDDYLFYLEEILQRIHTAYFKISDELNAEGKVSEVNLDLNQSSHMWNAKFLKVAIFASVGSSRLTPSSKKQGLQCCSFSWS